MRTLGDVRAPESEGRMTPDAIAREAALRASAIRHGLPPARSLGLSRQMMAQIVITAQMREAAFVRANGDG